MLVAFVPTRRTNRCGGLLTFLSGATMVFQSIANWPNNIVRCLVTGEEFTYENGNLASRQAAEAAVLAAQGTAIDTMRSEGFLLPIDDANDLRVLQQRYGEYLASL
jgi:hypothetical protein